MGSDLSQWVLEMMINALKMTSLLGMGTLVAMLIDCTNFFLPFTYFYYVLSHSFFSSLIFTMSRRELVWPELDQLLRDEDDPTTVTTPYTAAVLEYRVVFYDSADASVVDKSLANGNGNAVYDAQHPCRYEW